MTLTSSDHPLPPTDLNSRELQIEILASSSLLFRIHQSVYSPIFFGQSLPHRFDAPKQYGILYAGMTAQVAFLETMRGRVAGGWIDRNSLTESSISQLAINRSLKLIRASGSNLERIGANSGIFSTKNRLVTQQWSLAFWHHPIQADGIMYPSCHDNEQFCVALYSDRLQGVIDIHSIMELLSPGFSDHLTEITETYGYKIAAM
jgi:hypothetical protein